MASPDLLADPRVAFAEERTVLAWVRTALGLNGFGVLIAKGLHFLPATGEAPAHWSYLAIGLIMTLMAAALNGVAAHQHIRFIRSLPKFQRPVERAFDAAKWTAITQGCISLLLALWLILTW
jgi:putative membrane protein